MRGFIIKIKIITSLLLSLLPLTIDAQDLLKAELGSAASVASSAHNSLGQLRVQDSVIVKAHASYDSVSQLHRFFFGKNYRKEWAAPTKVPVIKISEFQGGLTPLRRGGGHQSRTLRLEDKTGKEWVLRSIRKYPAVLLPESLRETFALDWLDDNMSAQHPYSALIVPVIAEVVKIPHANPIIGVVANEKELGTYSDFANTLCLLEEREPVGDSDNTLEMLENLSEDNDHSVDREMFLRAIMVDVIVGDWDRHVDQWRWAYKKDDKGKYYIPVPRDRDQVFYISQGVLPKIVSKPWYLPFLEGFDEKVRNINTYLWEARTLLSRIVNGISYERWMHISHDVKNAVTDSVLEAAIKNLPESSQKIRHDILLETLKSRRDRLPQEMEKLYYFQNKFVDIQTTDKNELVEIKGYGDNSLSVNISKISKKGNIKQYIFSNRFSPSVTKELRLFIAKGDDSVKISELRSPIKVRIVGGEGSKVYSANRSDSKIIVYEKEGNAKFLEEGSKISKHLSDDTSNTSIIPTNRYNITKPLINIGYNLDDGFILGLGIKYTHQGFRKVPYASTQWIALDHSFSTDAFRIRYDGEWIDALRKADIIVGAFAYAPRNTMNFFGRGNETEFNKTGDYKQYYRSRFDFFQIDAAVRWRSLKGMTLSIGPSAQYYNLDRNDNLGRFITANASDVNSYDSSTIANKKIHGGVIADFSLDRRNNPLLPSSGIYHNLRIQGYKGLNDFSKSFMQIMPQMSFYKSLTADSSLVIADRIGGGVTLGNSAFYQSLFLGGQDNLQGFRQFRFAGDHMLFNNFEMRLRLGFIASYILPGELGLLGFYDVGRVWQEGTSSNRWHNGVGAGAYFSPARLTLIRFTAGYSNEGWYPNLSVGFRY